jgi:hypothetical protein
MEQLQRFATQLSIRLIWMERAHATIFAPADEGAIPDPRPASALAEVTTTPVTVPGFDWSAIPWHSITIIACITLASLLVLIILCRSLIRTRRRRMLNSVWLLPDAEIQPRLGAPHCGQGGVWVRYG